MGICAVFDYPVGPMRICKTIRGVEVSETKFKTAKAVLLWCKGFPGTVCEKHCNCLSACCWRNA